MADQFRFGIGEWYGKSFIHLTLAERQAFCRPARDNRLAQPLCLPRLTMDYSQRCTKKGGVCSIRKYGLLENQIVSIGGTLITTCPHRFKEGNLVFQWASEHVLKHHNPLIVREVGFLEKLPSRNNEDEEKTNGKPVGKIDMVLVHPEMERLSWCALEMQAVYFSGDSMNGDFIAIANFEESGVPFPFGKRRPDYRSSGPKRLMPQLQIKVPTLRRWGKKMVVVVDESFFQAMGPMAYENDITNCDIVWLIVGYNEEGDQATMNLRGFRFTTLDRAIEGLTAGNPVTLNEFENRIREKLGE